MVYPFLTNEAITTTETSPMQDLSTCDGRIDMINERVLLITRECMGSSLYDVYNSSRALKRYILLNSTHFIKFRSFKL